MDTQEPESAESADIQDAIHQLRLAMGILEEAAEYLDQTHHDGRRLVQEIRRDTATVERALHDQSTAGDDARLTAALDGRLIELERRTPNVSSGITGELRQK